MLTSDMQGQHPQGGPPGQQQYGAPPPGGQYGGPPPQQVSQLNFTSQQHRSLTIFSQGPPGDTAAYRQLLQSCIQEKNLQTFYPPNSTVVEQIAQKAPQLISQIISQWRLPKELANDVVKLALYDIILYIGRFKALIL